MSVHQCFLQINIFQVCSNAAAMSSKVHGSRNDNEQWEK